MAKRKVFIFIYTINESRSSLSIGLMIKWDKLKHNNVFKNKLRSIRIDLSKKKTMLLCKYINKFKRYQINIFNLLININIKFVVKLYIIFNNTTYVNLIIKSS